MSVATSNTSTASPATYTSSAKIRTFAVTFGVAFAVLYTVCEQMNWPLFTYHPAVDKWDLGMQPPRSGEGPPMYWYGWIVTSAIASSLLGAIATLLPDKLTSRLPLASLVVVPMLCFVVLGYSLSSFLVR